MQEHLKEFQIKLEQDRIKRAEKAKQHRLKQKLEKLANKDVPKVVLDPTTLLIHPCDLEDAMFVTYNQVFIEQASVSLVKPEE